MIVYRIEHESCNYGPFNAWYYVNTEYYDDERLDRLADRLNDKFKTQMRYTSWPEFDLGDRNLFSYRFGCRSVKQLVAWFHEDLNSFERNNFMIVEYTIDPRYVLDGKNQVNFNIDMAEIVQRYRIKHIKSKYVKYIAWLNKIRKSVKTPEKKSFICMNYKGSPLKVISCKERRYISSSSA